MKITYTPNPLYTTIELDEHEKKELWYKIKIEEYEEHIYGAYHTLTHHEWYNANIAKAAPRTLEQTMEEAAKELDPEYWCTDERSKLDERVDELLQHYLEELQLNHVGDCTCVACSCSKCHAEVMLGINTTKGLSNHGGSKLTMAFGQKNERSLDEALEYLRTYEPKADWKGWEAHAARWKEDARRAYEWLSEYKKLHFGPEISRTGT